MRILWAAMLGLTATAWNFEGDWASWDESRGVEETRTDRTLSYSTPDLETDDVGFYELRAMGRSEARWMGTNTGGSPEAAGQEGLSYFDWSRQVGRAEAHLTDGLQKTGEGFAAEGQAAEDRSAGCTLPEAARAEGRSESKDTDPDSEPTASPGQDVSESC